MKPSLIPSPELLSDSWVMALLGSMLSVMFLMFSAMLYVWRRHQLHNKTFLSGILNLQVQTADYAQINGMKRDGLNHNRKVLGAVYWIETVTFCV